MNQEGLPRHPFFERLAQPDRAAWPALRAAGRTLDYASLVRGVESLARGLEEGGVKPGQRVLVLLPDSPEHVLAMLALLALGAVAVPVHPQAGARRLAGILEEVRPSASLLAPGATVPPGSITFTLELDEGGRPRLDGVPLEATGPLRPVLLDEERPAMIRFSSGSTGQPKGALLDHRHLLWSARTLSRVFGLEPGHRELLVASMAYSGAWQRVVATLHAGGCVVLLEGPPALPVLLETMEQEEIRGFYTPPPLARMLLEAPGQRLRRAVAGCRTLEIGSAPISGEEVKRLMELLPEARIFVHYGMTECSRALILDARAHPHRCHTVGRPADGVSVQVVDDAGRSLPPGEAGQIRLRGPQMASGYLGRSGRAAESFRDGWLLTGDHGVLDGGGFLTFLGRADDRINCGGHSFFPAEVEAELGPVEGVQGYLVAGVPDPRGVLGQVPWAFVVPEPRDDWSPLPFLQQARRRLPGHKVPRGVEVLASLPLTSSGKPDRRRTLELYAPVGRTRDAARRDPHPDS